MLNYLEPLEEVQTNFGKWTSTTCYMWANLKKRSARAIALCVWWGAWWLIFFFSLSQLTIIVLKHRLFSMVELDWVLPTSRSNVMTIFFKSKSIDRGKTISKSIVPLWFWLLWNGNRRFFWGWVEKCTIKPGPNLLLFLFWDLNYCRFQGQSSQRYWTPSELGEWVEVLNKQSFGMLF